MKRNRLFLLLVAVLLAALVSTSAAFAEAAAAAPKLTPNGDKKAVSEKLDGSKYWGYYDPQISWKPENIKNGYIEWKSANENVVRICGDNRTDIDEATTEVKAPALSFSMEACKEVAVTGELHLYNDEIGGYRKSDITVSFPVTLEIVPERTMNFKQATYKFNKMDDGKFRLAPAKEGEAATISNDGNFDFTNEVEMAKKAAETDPEPTFGVYNLYWKVDNNEYASVNKNGVVTIKKVDSKEHEVTLSATTKNSNQTFTTKLVIAAKVAGDPKDPEAEKEEGYSSLRFTYDTFTATEEDNVNLLTDKYYYDMAYLEVKGNTRGKDNLIWSSSDMEKAVVDNSGNLTAKKATEEGKPVTITVKSKLNPDVKAECKIVIKAKKASSDPQKAKFEDVKFAEESLKVYVKRTFTEEGDEIYQPTANLKDYLITKGGKATTATGVNDSIIWLSDDNRVVSVNDNGAITAFKVTETPVTITAKSKNGDKSATIKIEVIEDPEEAKKAFTSVKSSVDALTMYLGDPDLNLGNYITTAPANNTDDWLVWTTSDPAIVDVDRHNGNIWANKVGEATITAKSVRGSKKAEIKITVKEESEKPKAIGTLKAAVSSLVMYEDDTNNVWDYFLYDNWNDDTILFTSSNRDVVDFIWDGGFDEDDEWYEIDRPYSSSIWAKKPGTATLTATSKLDPTKTASIKVTVKAQSEKLIPFATVTQAMTDLTIYEGEGINPWDYISVTPVWNDDDFVWTTDNAEIVRLRGQYASFEAVKAGKATITGKAKLGGQTVTFNITVKPETEKPITSIKASQTDLTVYEGDEYWLRDYLTIEPQNHWDELIWASKDESVAIVEHEHEGESGKMYAINEGTTEIVVRSNRNPSATVKFNITVKKNPEKLIQSVKFTEDKFTVNLAKTLAFDANPYTVINPGWDKLAIHYYDEEADEDQVVGYTDWLVWTSSNPQVAAVEDGNVYLSGVQFGDEPVEVTITARSARNPEAKPASFTLTVKNEKVAFTKIAATQATLTLKAEDIVYLGDYVTVEPEDNDDDLVWTSSDPYIVDAAYGVIEIKKPGTATITARSALDPTVEPATITVTVPEEKPVELGFINDTPKKLRFDQYEGDFDEEELAIASLDLNKYLTAKPVYYASDEDYREKLVWKTSNPQVALVYNGIVYFMAPGDVTITVYDESYTVKAETELTLLKPVIAKIGMNASELAMKTGETELAWLNMRVLKQDNGKYITKGFSAYDIIWTSSNPHVVDIGKEDGIMTAGEPGTAKITASIVNDEDGSIATGSFTVEVTKVDVESIKFAKSKYTINSSADRYSTVLKFKVSPVNADFNPNDYIVKTEKRVVADVWFEDESTIGLMVNGSGTTTIVIRRASDNKLMAKTKVVVKPLYVDGIRIKEKNVRMNFYKLDDLRLYQNMQVITPVIKPANADYTVRWETSDASVAFVNWFDSLTNEVIDDSSLSSYKMSGTEARIIATGAGQATLTMTVDDGKKVRTAKVKVVVTTRQIVPKLNKTKATITMIKGEDKSLQLTATDKQTGEPIEVKWSSSNKKIAKVTKNGLVKPLKAGKVTITATSTDGLETKATCKITIKQNPVKALKVKKTELTMTVGEEKTLKVKVKPTDAYDKGLTFKSSKSKVVSVDKDGKLVAKKAGKATITAKATDGSKKSVKITVTVKAAEETEAK